MLNRIDVPQFKTKLKDEFGATQLGAVQIGDSGTTIVLFSMELAEHNVVAALYIEPEVSTPGEAEIGVSVKFSICSKDDIYDEEVGRSIAVGRAIMAGEHDFVVSVNSDKINMQTLNSSVDDLVVSRVSKLEETLEGRERVLGTMRRRQQDVYEQIGESLKEFK